MFCMHTPHFVYFFIIEHLAYLNLLQLQMMILFWTWVYKYFFSPCFKFCWLYTRSGIAGWYDRLCLTLRNCQIVFHSGCIIVHSFFSIFKNFFKCLFLRERERVHGGGAEREREAERIPTRLHAVSPAPDAGLEPTNGEIMTWVETKSQMLNRLSHPGACFL